MKKIFLTIVCLGLCIAQSFAQTFSYLSSGHYGYGTLSAGSTTYWKVFVPAQTMGVFTLKNYSSTSDFDLYLYSSSSLEYSLGSGINNSTTTELITIPIKDYGRYVYVKIKNAGRYSSKYHFHSHTVDFIKKAEEALVDASAQYLLEEGIKWLLDIKSSDQNYSQKDRNVGRASTLILSALKNDNLGKATESFIINEITTAVRNEFGYGFWGNLMVNYGINVIREVYKHY